MRVVALVENNTKSAYLDAEHGLSLYIETENHKIIFDTGATNLFILNAVKLNINLQEVDYVVISHGHYDHIGGLIHFLQLNQKAKIILKKEIFEYQYISIRQETKKNIGCLPELLNYKERFIYPENAIETIDNLHVITKINSVFALPKGNNILFKTSNNVLKPDDFSHELILTIEEKNEMYVFCGCAHNGVLNTISAVQQHLPNKLIKTIIGGFHLIDSNEFVETESAQEIKYIATILKQLSFSTNYYTGHCTSNSAFNVMREILEDKLKHIEIGETLEV